MAVLSMSDRELRRLDDNPPIHYLLDIYCQRFAAAGAAPKA